MLVRGIGFWFGVKAMVAIVIAAGRAGGSGLLLSGGIADLAAPSVMAPIAVAVLAFVHSAAMKETIFFRNLGIRWLPVAGPAAVAAALEIAAAAAIPGG